MNPTFRIETSVGNFTVELFREKAPITAQNFCEYARDGHYIGTIFHRLVYDFIIQGGGYTEAADTLEKKPTRAPIKNEANNGLSNRHYTIAMARTDEMDSATSQFFINLKDNEDLDTHYCVFGRVSEGQNVIDTMALYARRTFGGFMYVPVPPPVINKVVDLTKL